jgi:RNA polymerase sigma factor (sigma-70 family)
LSEVAEVVDRARDDSLPIDQQHEAFAELVARFEEAAFVWSLRRLGDAEEARDVCQDAFVTAWLKLRQLRDGAAFAGWLRRLVVTQCNRRLRRVPPVVALEEESRAATEQHLARREEQRLIASALAKLPESQHRVVVLFYYLGRTLDEIATLLGIPRGTVGKRLYSARLAIRRQLPHSARAEVLQLRPSRQFLRRIREGLFDEYVGEYRFANRPELVVRIAREGEYLVSYGAGQRNVLASLGEQALITTGYDGEGRFQRDRKGRVVQFVYYEFGARLGVASRLDG